MKELNKDIRLNVVVGEYGRAFKLLEPITFKARIDGEIIEINIPKGFVTDFASTPKSLWWFFGPIGTHIIPATIHDYIYTSQLFSKEIADKLFYDAIKDYGVNSWKAWTVYKAVSMAGDENYGTPEPKFY